MGESDVSLTKKTERQTALRLRDTRRARAQSARYSQLISVLRWVFPLFAVFFLVVLVVWPQWVGRDILLPVATTIPDLMVEKLSLNGLDGKGQAYTLTAERALQASKTKSLIDLDGPKGEWALNNGAWLAVRAEHGRLDQEAKKVWLGGRVELFHDEGYRLSSEELSIDITRGLAWGERPVVLQGSFGVIEGAGFRVLDGGAVIVVTGPAKARLVLEAKGGGAPCADPGQCLLNRSSSR